MLVQHVIRGELLKAHLHYLTDGIADLTLKSNNIQLTTTIYLSEDNAIDNCLEEAFFRLYAAKHLYLSKDVLAVVIGEYKIQLKSIEDKYILNNERRYINEVIIQTQAFNERQKIILKDLIKKSYDKYQELRQAIVKDIIPRPFQAVDIGLFDQLLVLFKNE